MLILGQGRLSTRSGNSCSPKATQPRTCKQTLVTQFVQRLRAGAF